MVTDLLTTKNFHSRLASNVDLLIRSDSLKYYLKTFLRDNALKGLSPRTVDDYKQKLDYFIKFCDELKITNPKSLKLDHFKDYISFIQGWMKPASVAGYFRAIRRFCNYLIEEQVIKVSPMQGMKCPKLPKQIIQPLKDSHIHDLLNWCDDSKFLGARDRAIILVLLDTGLRLSELSNMKVSDVFSSDLTTMYDSFKVMGKGAKERKVAISRRTQSAINKYYKLRHSELPQLWLSEERTPITSWGIYQSLHDLGKLAGITDVHFNTHNYRHTFATRVLMNGGNVYELQALLGHSSLEMTKRYVSSLNSENAIISHKKFSPVNNMKL